MSQVVELIQEFGYRIVENPAIGETMYLVQGSVLHLNPMTFQKLRRSLEYRKIANRIWWDMDPAFMRSIGEKDPRLPKWDWRFGD
jgi:hypothetical protein